MCSDNNKLSISSSIHDESYRSNTIKSEPVLLQIRYFITGGDGKSRSNYRDIRVFTRLSCKLKFDLRNTLYSFALLTISSVRNQCGVNLDQQKVEISCPKRFLHSLSCVVFREVFLQK